MNPSNDVVGILIEVCGESQSDGCSQRPAHQFQASRDCTVVLPLRMWNILCLNNPGEELSDLLASITQESVLIIARVRPTDPLKLVVGEGSGAWIVPSVQSDDAKVACGSDGTHTREVHYRILEGKFIYQAPDA